MVEVTPTRGTALALAEEKSFLETGFGFLDEKRMMLAATLLRELRAWSDLRDEYSEQIARTVSAMKAAITRHGLENLQRYPVLETLRELPGIRQSPILGVGLIFDMPELRWHAPRVENGPDLSEAAENLRKEAARLVPLAVRLAFRQSNVCRLLREYRDTDRRARALENVLIPETREKLAQINEYLNEFDQEEAIRIRNAVR